MPQSLHDQVLQLRTDLSGILLERERAVDSALLALLTGEHLLLLGPPGTAKSLLVRQLCTRLTGATYYEHLMSPVTVPDDLFGPVDLLKYADHGIYTRRSKGAMQEAHIVFFDEFFRSNGAMKDTLLTLMNERLLAEVGFDPRTVPLLSLFAASNGIPDDDTISAVNDRFMLREHVDYVSDEVFFQLMTAPLDKQAINQSLSLDDLRQAQAECQAIQGTKEALEALLELRQQLRSEGILLSDRRWRHAGGILRAYAWLQGDSSMLLDHLTCLDAVVWLDPKERRAAQRCVYKLAAPLDLTALEVQDAAAELIAAIGQQRAGAEVENGLQQLADMHTRLHAQVQQSTQRDKRQAIAALNAVALAHQGLAKRLLESVQGLNLGGRA